MAKVSDGLPEGYAPDEVFILKIGGVDYYVNCDGIPLSELGKRNPTPEMMEAVESRAIAAEELASEVQEALADAQAEIERLRALVKDTDKKDKEADKPVTATPPPPPAK